MFKKNNGFTLIEVMIVMVIIGLISNMAIVNYGNKTDEAKKIVDQGNIVNISTALELYAMENSEYPKNAPDASSENPLLILLGEGEEGAKTKVYLKMDVSELKKYKYTLLDSENSYTVIREDT